MKNCLSIWSINVQPSYITFSTVLWHSFHQRWAILGILWNAGAQGSRVRADPTFWSTSWADFELFHCVRVSHVAFGDVDVCGLPGGGGSEHQRWWHFHEDPRPANFPKIKNYHLVMTNSLPWKILYKMEVLYNGKIIYKWVIFHGYVK